MTWECTFFRTELAVVTLLEQLSLSRHVTAASRMLERARAIYREKGSGGIVRSAGNFASRLLGLKVGKRGEYLRQKMQVDKQFDQQCGTDTGGVQNLYNLTISGPNALHGGTHIAVD